MAVPGAENLGVSPFVVIQLALAMYALLYWHKHGLVIPIKWKWFTFWFLAFTVISLVSAFTFPFLFDGMRVYTPRGGVDPQYLNPGVLEFSVSNIAQALYLFLYATGVLILITRFNTTLLEATNRAYLFAGILVCVFSYYQLISIVTGIYYPDEILYNNANFDLAGDRSISFLPRIYSTFSESSFYAIFMASFLAWVYVKFVNEPDKSRSYRWLGLLICTMFSLLISTSSTGFVTVALFFILHTISSFFLGTGKKQKLRIMMILSSFVVILLALYLFVPNVDSILNEIIFDKGTSQSSLHRFEADRFAFVVFFKTYLLGSGLGSNRPSSFLAFLVSNVGVLGTFCIVVSILILYLMSFRAIRSSAADASDKVTCQASGWALFVILLAKLLGGPDLNFPPMWILVGYFILSIMQLDAGPKKIKAV